MSEERKVVTEHRPGVCPVCGLAVDIEVDVEHCDLGGGRRSFSLEHLPYRYRPLSPTPLQAAAFAALVAWRRVGLAFDRTDFDSWPDWHEQWEASEEALRTTADALLAAEGGTG